MKGKISFAKYLEPYSEEHQEPLEVFIISMLCGLFQFIKIILIIKKTMD